MLGVLYSCRGLLTAVVRDTELKAIRVRRRFAPLSRAATSIIPIEIQSFHLRPDNGHELAFHWYVETLIALFSWRVKEQTCHW